MSRALDAFRHSGAFRATVLLSVLIASPTVAQEPTKVTYEEHIKPILTESCVGCHSQRRARNGLALDTYEGLLQGGSSGASIVKGDPGASLLYQLVARTREPFMPDGEDKLPDGTVELLRQWIAMGAPRTQGDAVMTPAPGPRALEPAALAVPAGAAAMPVNVRNEPYWWTERPNTVNAVAASPFAPLIAVAGHRQVLLFHAETGERIGVLDFPEGEVHVLRFSRDGSLVLAAGGRGGESGRAVAWNVISGERVLEIGNEPEVVLAADLSEDRRLLAIGGPDRVVRVYDTATAALVHEIRKHTDWITALEFSPDGVLLATGDRSGGAFVWESETAREFHTLPVHTGPVTDISWRADSALLLTSGNDGVVRILDAENGREQRAWNTHQGVLSAEFDRQGRIATCGRDRVARLFDGNGAELRGFGPLVDAATAVAVSHDGSRLVVGGWTGEVAVYDCQNGPLLAQLPANSPTVWEVTAARLAESIASLEGGLEPLRVAAAESSARAQSAAVDADAVSQRAMEARSRADAAAVGAEQARADIEQAAAREQSLRAAVAACEAAAGAAQTALTAAQQAAAKSEAEMLAAIAHVATLEASLDDGLNDEDRSRVEGDLAIARRLVDGACAVAERDAVAAARQRVTSVAADATLAQVASRAGPAIEAALAARAAAQSVLDEAARLHAEAEAAAADAAAMRAIADAAKAEADAAAARITEHEAALARARDDLISAKALWEIRRAEIIARSGRVDG